MKKLIILCLTLFILTGCQVKYNLNFKDESLTEDISIILDKNYDNNDINNLKKQVTYAINDGISIDDYDKSYEEITDGFKANYNHTYNLVDYNRGYLLNQCYDAANFVTNKDEYILSTSDIFRCLTYEYLTVDSVKVAITSNHKVLDSNADDVNDGKYTWNINSENFENKPIYIKFGKVKKSFWDYLLQINPLYLFIIGAIIVIGFISLIVFIKSQRNNRI